MSRARSAQPASGDTDHPRGAVDPAGPADLGDPVDPAGAEEPADGVGRRERKKNDTRQALRQAAHRLFAEQGFARTTIDQITEAADVSRRTFFRYYSSKQDLLRLEIADVQPAMLSALRARPSDEAPLPAIRAALRTLMGPSGPPEIAASLAGSLTGARARLGLVRLLADWEGGIADALLARRGLDPATAPEADRLRAVVTACAATSALRASVQTHRTQYPDLPLDPRRLTPIVDQAFAVLADGCSNPEVGG
ncbi:MAG TPA: TetR family transcriptional regulator [Actinocrinis sp.]|nr:TetR family transcriptional regulator [Actinocrinis sp.]